MRLQAQIDNVRLSTLVKSYQDGSISRPDMTVLLNIINDSVAIKYYNAHINTLIDIDDVKQEYWMGVIQYLPKVNLNMACTIISYLRKCGMLRIKRYFRKQFKKSILISCKDCGKINMFYMCNGTCQYCGSNRLEMKVKNAMFGDDFDGTLWYNAINIMRDEYHDIESIENRFDMGIFIKKFKYLLEERSKKYSSKLKDIFDDLISISFDRGVGYNGDYIGDIANKYGVSRFAIVDKVKKLKKLYGKFISIYPEMKLS